MHVNDLIPNPMKLHEENQQLRRMIDNLKEDLRDQFAMAVVQGMYASLIDATEWPTEDQMEDLARRSYDQADTMLRAREGREG